MSESMVSVALRVVAGLSAGFGAVSVVAAWAHDPQQAFHSPHHVDVAALTLIWAVNAVVAFAFGFTFVVGALLVADVLRRLARGVARQLASWVRRPAQDFEPPPRPPRPSQPPRR